MSKSFWHKKRKGVSPLIAAVLLIAFTMAVAAILTAWVTTFTKEKAGEVGNQSDQLIECSYAGLTVYDAHYNSGASRLDVTIANTGSVNLRNVTAYVFSNAAVQGQSPPISISSSELKSTNITGINSRPDRIRITTSQCPQTTAETSSISTS